MLGSPVGQFWKAVRDIQSARFLFEVQINRSSMSEKVFNIEKKCDPIYTKIIHCENSYEEALAWCKYHRMEVTNAIN